MKTTSHQQLDINHANGATIDLKELPPDLALIRIEMDNIQAMASTRPRDLETVKHDVLEQIKVFPAVAEELIYSRPVGKDPETGQEKIARDLSIRAAEMLAEAYAYNSVEAKTTILNDTMAQVEAVFVDYQRGRRWKVSNPVSRVYKMRGGGTGTTPMDRFLETTCKGAQSKAIREAILRCIPPGLKQALFEAAEKQIGKLLSDDRIDLILKNFSGKGVTLPMLEGLLGRTKSQGWTIEDRKNLAGIWHSLEHNEATVGEIFGGVGGVNGGAGGAAKPTAERAAALRSAAAQADPAQAAVSPGRVTADDLLNPKGRGASRPAPTTHKTTAPSHPAPSHPATSPQPPAASREPGEDDSGIGGYEDQETAEQEEQETEEQETEEQETEADAEVNQTAYADESEYPGEGEPEEAWYVNLQEELAECTGIRDSKLVSDRYCGAQSPLTPYQKKVAAELIAEFQEKIRGSRGGRGNRGQGTLI